MAWPAADSTSTSRPDAEKIEDLFLWAFGRKPTAKDTEAAQAHIAKYADKPNGKKTAYENILWALLNSSEFSVSH